MTPTEWKDLLACPLMLVKAFVDALGLSASGGKKFLEAAGPRIVTVGGVDFAFPLEVSHSARGWRAEGVAK